MQCSALKAVHRRKCYTYQKYQSWSSCSPLWELQCSVLSVIHTHQDISAADRAAGAHIDESIDTSSAEPRMAARDMCDAISLPDIRHTSQQLSASAVAPAMWKSSQSLQQVMPWPLAGRRRHLHRWWTRRGSAAEHQCARRRCDSLTFNALSNLYSTPRLGCFVT